MYIVHRYVFTVVLKVGYFLMPKTQNVYANFWYENKTHLKEVTYFDALL